MFSHGTYSAPMDIDGNLTLPEKFREELASGVTLTKGQERCLYVFLRADFAHITEPLRSAPFTDKNKRLFGRVLFASVADQVPNKYGGITIPKDLRNYASLRNECIVIGVNDRLEIWDAAAWNSYLSDGEDRFAAWPGEIPFRSRTDR
jgi:transcriptional regulator MraZ